jgi:hypothetical protein
MLGTSSPPVASSSSTRPVDSSRAATVASIRLVSGNCTSTVLSLVSPSKPSTTRSHHVRTRPRASTTTPLDGRSILNVLRPWTSTITWTTAGRAASNASAIGPPARFASGAGARMVWLWAGPSADCAASGGGTAEASANAARRAGKSAERPWCRRCGRQAAWALWRAARGARVEGSCMRRSLRASPPC